MGRVVLEFCRSRSLVGRAIQAATWSPYDHVGFVRDGLMFSALPDGVGWSDPRTEGRIARFVAPCVDDALNAALTQRGKPYDFGAVIGVGLHRDWRDPSRWFCSELVAWAFERVGWPLVRAVELDRITPGTLATSVRLRLSGQSEPRLLRS